MAHYREMGLTVDDTFFIDKINEITGGKLVNDRPTIYDLLNHYGSTSTIANLLVQTGMYNNYKHPYNAAIRQVQRMLKNPNIRLKPGTEIKFNTLSLPFSVVEGRTVVIRGYFSYDFVKWAFAKFSYTPSQHEWRSILNNARYSNANANQDTLDAFLMAYGVGISLSFSTGTTISM